MNYKKHHLVLAGLLAIGLTITNFSLDATRIGRVVIQPTSSNGKTGVCSSAITPTLQVKAPVTTTTGSESIVAKTGNTTTSYKFTDAPAPKDTTVVLRIKGQNESMFSSLFNGPRALFFSDSDCKNQVAKIIIPKGYTSIPVYVAVAFPDTYTITASATNYTEGTASYLAVGNINNKITTILNNHNAGGSTNGTFEILTPTPGAIDVTKLTGSTVASANGTDTNDDTAAFTEAVRQASIATNKQFAQGPTGAPQGVVYVPAGTYYIRDVQLKDNVRVEINAGAVLKQTLVKSDKNANGVSLFVIGSSKYRTAVPTAPLQNVSLVGVGQSATMAGIPKPATYNGWDISGSFTVNADPATTDASQLLKPLSLMYANGVLIQNVFGIANNSDVTNRNPLNSYNRGSGVNVQSTLIWGNNQVNIRGTTSYYGPTNVTINNVYATKQTFGYGAIQLQSARTFDVKNIFSEGGTALRLESGVPGAETLTSYGCVRRQQGGGGTDCKCTETSPCALNYFSEINGVVADNISCLNGNTAVSLLPHEQTNSNVTVTNVRSDNCYSGVLGGYTGDPRIANKGLFSNVTINGLTVFGSDVDGSGRHAQGAPLDFGLDSTTWAPDVASGTTVSITSKSIVPLVLSSCTKQGYFEEKNPKRFDQSYPQQCSLIGNLKAQSGALKR